MPTDNGLSDTPTTTTTVVVGRTTVPLSILKRLTRRERADRTCLARDVYVTVWRVVAAAAAAAAGKYGVFASLGGRRRSTRVPRSPQPRTPRK